MTVRLFGCHVRGCAENLAGSRLLRVVLQALKEFGMIVADNGTEMLPALAAAVIGRMESLPRTVAAALVLYGAAVLLVGFFAALLVMGWAVALGWAEERIVGVLHDVVEDGGSEWTFERLASEGFAPEVIDALRLVTKRPEDQGDDIETYLRFVRRTLANPIARRVKLSDIRDNLDVSRMETVTEKDAARLNRYLAALRLLMEDK